MYYKDGLPKRLVVMNLPCDDAAAWDPESVERKSAQDLDAKLGRDVLPDQRDGGRLRKRHTTVHVRPLSYAPIQ